MKPPYANNYCNHTDSNLDRACHARKYTVHVLDMYTTHRLACTMAKAVPRPIATTLPIACNENQPMLAYALKVLLTTDAADVHRW